MAEPMEPTNEIAIMTGTGRVPVPMPTTLQGQLALAEVLMKGGAVPASLKTPQAVVMVMQSGAEIGMRPVASLRMHSVIQGKVTLSADGMAAVVLGSGLAEYFQPVEITAERATYVTKLKGAPKEVSLTFSMKQAEAAGLTAKNPTYKTYPERMLAARAKAFLARDIYPDVLGGMMSTEEAVDMPEPEHREPIRQPERIIDVQAEPTVTLETPLASEVAGAPRNPEDDRPRVTNGWMNPQDRAELNKECNAAGMPYKTLRDWLKGQGVSDATKIPRELKADALRFIRGEQPDETLPGLSG